MDYKSDFDEYKLLGEPEKVEKSEIWQIAIGLQQVDGLTPSEYLIETAKCNIEGEITFYEVQERLNSYYKAKPVQKADDRTEEADKVSARIAEILSEKTFSFSPAEYITIHKRLFVGIYKFAGEIRDYNISKDEWVLNGETVYKSVEIPFGGTYEVYVEVIDNYGFCYRSLIDHTAIDDKGTPVEDMNYWHGSEADIYDENGNVLWESGKEIYY